MISPDRGPGQLLALLEEKVILFAYAYPCFGWALLSLRVGLGNNQDPFAEGAGTQAQWGTAMDGNNRKNENAYTRLAG